uniref:Ubiquitin-like protease family profile domain-containing protein n=1 Tax=Trichobilharzia regenti TaxID=157069 RepID=A0AA85JKI2_TRIRE|nr:unnamed protein product [Trichobilharzia regenti]
MKLIGVVLSLRCSCWFPVTMHHLIGGSSPAPFCSTPGPANSFASSSLEVDGTVARKTESKNVLEVGQLTAKNFPSPPDMSPCNPLDEHRQDCRQHQFQSSGLNKPIGAGKKWSKYSKRLSRLFRHDNMILNRSYMTFDEVLSEVIVAKELTALGMGLTNCTSGFVELIKVHLLQGAFPSCMKKLWEAYDRVKGSENDHPNIFPDDQLWVVLESAFCGVPLGDNIPSCPCARLSLLLQVGFSLAVAEQEMNFEHRDLHLGNVLVKESPVSRARNPSLSSKTSSSSYPFPSGSVSSSSTSPKGYCKYCSHLEGVDEESDKENKEYFIIEKVNNYEYVEFRLNNQMIRVPKCGITAYLIDFTLSRLEQVAEREMNFEHRDLHLGNVLVKESPVSRARNPSLSSKTSSSSYPFPSGSVSSSSTSPKSYCKYCSHLEGVDEESDKENKEYFIIEKVNNYEYVEFRLNNQMIRVPKCGITAYLIDFTLSRLEQDGGFVYVDLSSDTTLFQSKGDYQFDIYRRMKSHNRCGLRLPRSELRRTGTASTEPSIINRIVQGQALADTHYSVEPSSSQTVKHVNEGGLLTNVINTLTSNGFQLKTNSGSATHESNVNCRGKSETNELDEECDDLIIIHEENTSNVAAQPPGDNVQAESTTNCDEDSFKFDYKPAGSVDGITLTKSDLQCLEPGALINDAIINFYLKYLYFEQLTDFQRQATHVFNVFFYKAIRTQEP